jgi:hypothetical protein
MKKSLLLAALIVAIVSVVMNPIGVGAQQNAADKASAAASDLDTLGDTSEVVLEQDMSVSDTSDLILQTSAECSILTSLFTEGGPDAETETDGAFGQVEMWITLDDKRVPVSTDDGGDGEVVFCNRAYQRTVSDNEDPLDGLDSEDDFIRTRSANGFNWMAFDTGRDQEDGGYDAGRDNDLHMELHARYTKQPQECATREADDALAPYGETCADAFVGSRTLIAEAVHAINNEQADAGGQ